MKNTLLRLAFFTMFFAQSSAQSINCDRFCVDDISVHELQPDSLLVRIEFSEPADFINYPYVNAITNLSGDTIAIGHMFYFGQNGGSSQIYPTHLQTGFWDDNFAVTVHFKYDNLLCMLPYPCVSASLSEKEFSNEMIIFSHSNERKLTITLKNGTKIKNLFVFDLTGISVLNDSITTELHTIDLNQIRPGKYLIKVVDMNGISYYQRVLVP